MQVRTSNRKNRPAPTFLCAFCVFTLPQDFLICSCSLPINVAGCLRSRCAVVTASLISSTHISHPRRHDVHLRSQQALHEPATPHLFLTRKARSPDLFCPSPSHDRALLSQLSRLGSSATLFLALARQHPTASIPGRADWICRITAKAAHTTKFSECNHKSHTNHCHKATAVCTLLFLEIRQLPGRSWLQPLSYNMSYMSFTTLRSVTSDCYRRYTLKLW